MWDRSYRWQQRGRVTTGVVVLFTLGIVFALLTKTSAAHRLHAGASELASEVLLPDRQIIEAQVPASLKCQVGTLVYRERQDGIAQVIGRVVQVAALEPDQTHVVIRLSSASAELARHGGVLKGAPSALSLGEAARLLVSPDTPFDEMMMARDQIWPSVRTNLVPEIMNDLIREISAELANPSPENEALFERVAAYLHQAIEPLEGEFVERLAKRAWVIVGMQGFVSGTLRSKTPAPKQEGDNPAAHPFLSEKSSQALKAALEEEALAFWKEHRGHIVDAFKNALNAHRQDFEKAFQDRWSETLYERVIVPAWQVGQPKVIESIEGYVRDFASRRLFTKQGGPRLLFAYILRGYLDISASPLLILAAATDQHSDKITYEPLMR